MLDRLGGGAWQAKKARLKERIREMADKLIRVAAERALRRAPGMEPPCRMLGSVQRRAFPIRKPMISCSAIERCADRPGLVSRWTA